jgi:hypothetical protein
MPPDELPLDAWYAKILPGRMLQKHPKGNKHNILI